MVTYEASPEEPHKPFAALLESPPDNMEEQGFVLA